MVAAIESLRDAIRGPLETETIVEGVTAATEAADRVGTLDLRMDIEKAGVSVGVRTGEDEE